MRTSLQGGVALCLPPAFASAAAPAPLELTRLTDRISVIAGAGGNVTVIDTPDGVALIDGGDATHSSALLDRVRDSSANRPVRTLFNTHWHAEQTGSNLALGKRGTKIIAHENTRLWLSTTVNLAWQGQVHPPLPAKARPSDTIHTSASLALGTQQIDYAHLPQAHTDGDLYVHLPQANVLIVGDLLAVDRYPILDYCTGGWIVGLLNASKALLAKCDAQTRIVPGIGAVQTRAQLQNQVEMLTQMTSRLVDLMRKGMSAQEMIAAQPGKDFDATWGDPRLFISNAYPGLWGHVREFAKYGYSGVV